MTPQEIAGLGPPLTLFLRPLGRHRPHSREPRACQKT